MARDVLPEHETLPPRGPVSMNATGAVSGRRRGKAGSRAHPEKTVAKREPTKKEPARKATTRKGKHHDAEWRGTSPAAGQRGVKGQQTGSKRPKHGLRTRKTSRRHSGVIH